MNSLICLTIILITLTVLVVTISIGTLNIKITVIHKVNVPDINNVPEEEVLSVPSMHDIMNAPENLEDTVYQKMGNNLQEITELFEGSDRV